MKKKLLLPVFAAFMIYTATDLNIETADAATPTQLIQTSSKYLGAPYVSAGITPSGFDCSGFTTYVFRELGINLNRTSAGQYSQGTAVSRNDLQVGDLLFFNTSGYGVSHVAIYIGNGKMIHSQSSKGVSYNNLTDSYWNKTYIGAKRVANFKEEQAQQVMQAATTVKQKEEVKEASIDFSKYASRGEVALQLAKALNLKTSDTNSPFEDIKADSKYAGAATALHKLGIFKGDNTGKFNPNSPLTRAQMAKVLVLGFNLKLQPGSIVQFSDVKSDNWSYEYVQILASNGVTTGLGNGLYGLGDNVKLTQLATFIERATKK